ncbi:MAG: D-alanyl-D-alanine carboxypeptidase [Candidatus Saccharibacteria bacterium]|nr:D-alanyl-D-alanine carboxypeptidase [Candidatus Saccharibacteria bacterium]
MSFEADPRQGVMDRELVKNILDKVGRDDRYTKTPLANLTFENLYNKLQPQEVELIIDLLAIDPKTLGFMGPFVTMENPPRDLAAIEGQQYTRGGENMIIANQYAPQRVLDAFQKMKQAIGDELQSDLLIESGYRSPAHQAIVFLTYLELSDFNIRYVASGVALPGFSQHGDPVNTALDVLNQDGIPTDEEPELFEKTKEYAWLVQNAGKFGFFLSYPRDNPHGVKFEPWHWRYSPV